VQVHKLYEALVQALGSEFEVLLNSPIPDIERNSNERVGLGIERMRRGEVQATAGYDGVFGVIQVLPGAAPSPAARITEPGTQMGLF
jgi:PHP family Zn ribbon phosphoesterase